MNNNKVMNKFFFRSALFGSFIALGIMTACTRSTDPTPRAEKLEDGADNEDRKYITLSATFPDAQGVPGNGGTLVYGLTEAEARDDTKTIDIYKDGYSVRSDRTARVQGSINGNYLYNIQYRGVNGGVFNKFKVEGAGNFIDTGEEINTAAILGQTPRWVKSAEGIGIGVEIQGYSSPIDPEKAENGTQEYVFNRGNIAVAVLDLHNPSLINSTDIVFPLSEEDKKAGYTVDRVDVPVLNEAKTKVFIGCKLMKVNPNKPPVKMVNARTGVEEWVWENDDANIRGTVSLVLDYPSLANPTLIWSTQSKFGNNSLRTMSQYVGTDKHVYQSTGVNIISYPHILRIDRATNTYDNDYLFDLAVALNITSGRVGIKAWTYIQDGKAIVIYDIDSKGGYIALIDLNAKTATKVANDFESQLDFTQFQNIVVAGDNAFIPLTPPSLDGQLYIVNWKTGATQKGVKLKNQSGSYYIGSY